MKAKLWRVEKDPLMDGRWIVCKGDDVLCECRSRKKANLIAQVFNAKKQVSRTDDSKAF